jgi:hypothetical protein
MAPKTPEDLARLFRSEGLGRKLTSRYRGSLGYPQRDFVGDSGIRHVVSREDLNGQGEYPAETLALNEDFMNILQGSEGIEDLKSQEMRSWIVELGYDPADLDKLDYRKRHNLARGLMDKIIAETHNPNSTISRLSGGLSPAAVKEIDDASADIDAVERALARGFVLEKPNGSSWHHLQEYLVTPKGPVKALGVSMIDTQEIWASFQSIVVEHDWAKAFEGAQDFDGGEIVFPFDFTAFEFRVSGVRVIITVASTARGFGGLIVLGANGRWFTCRSVFDIIDGQIVMQRKGPPQTHFEEFCEMIVPHLNAQVRAICIVIESGIAQSQKIERGDKINKNRLKQGKSPLKAYHVVSLAKKYRDRADRAINDTGSPKRCHFRRGHWRVFKSPNSGQERFIGSDGFEVSRTRITWMLVGDPNLGFVDKHYKL